MNSENILEEIKTFIEDKCGIARDRIKSESRIEKDLRITGDDAMELLVDFGKKFNVDVSKFMAADYFDGEGMNLLLPNFGKKELTVHHLVKAVTAGKLDESVINS